jgi:hypothetical protein
MRNASIDVGLLELGKDGKFLPIPRGYGRDMSVKTPHSTIAGINLGFDFCAEHEWGYEDLKQSLGLPIKRYLDSFDDVMIPPQNPDLRYIHTKDYFACGLLRPYNNATQEFEKKVKAEAKYARPNSFQTMWDKSEFLIIGHGTCAEYVKLLYQKMMDGKVAIKQGTAIFGGGGLSFFFIDRLPAIMLKEFNEGCDDLKRLHATSDATGIAKRLADAGLRYYALSPRWADKGKKIVTYWLNPMDQHKYEHGWYSVAELDEWIAGKGPVMEKKKARV